MMKMLILSTIIIKRNVYIKKKHNVIFKYLI